MDNQVNLDNALYSCWTTPLLLQATIPDLAPAACKRLAEIDSFETKVPRPNELQQEGFQGDGNELVEKETTAKKKTDWKLR